jgi:hypothetical protein
MLVVKPIVEALKGALEGMGEGGGILGWFGRLFSGMFGQAHQGGIVGVTGLQQRRVPDLVFAGAQRFHSGGIAGLSANEVPIIAKKREMILTTADQKALLNIIRGNNNQKNGGLAVNVQVVNQTSVAVKPETEQRPNNSGGVDMKIVLNEVDRGLANKISGNESYMDNAMKGRYGLNDAQSKYRRG